MDDFLDRLLSADKKIREAATSQLDESITRPGFCLGLVSIARDQSLNLPRRQICLTVTKDLIRKRWGELSESDQSALLEALLPLSLDPTPSIRSLSHACIALGASRYGISRWSGLLQSISDALLAPQVSLDLKRAIIALLISIVEECGGSAILPIANDILAMLLEASSRHPGLERRSIEAWTCILVNLARDDEYDFLNAMQSDNKWKALLMSLMTSADMTNCIGGLKAITQLVSSNHFDSSLPAFINELLPACVVILNRYQKEYESLVLFGEEGGIDESEDGGLSTLVLSVCEFVNTVVISDELSNMLIRDNLLEKFFWAVAPYLQIPLSVEEEWIQSPVEFIAQEQDDLASSTSIRIVFEGIVADTFTNPLLCECGIAITQALGVRMIGDGIKAQKEDNPEAWRLVEAGLFALGLTSYELSIRSVDESIHEILKLAASLVLSNDSSRPLLKARALVTLSKFAEIASKHFSADLSTILQCSVQALNGDNVVVIYAACRALNAFIPFVEKTAVNMDLISQAAKRLVQLASSAKEHEVVHFALESLIGIASNSSEIMRNIWNEEVDALFIPSMLASYVSDPIVPAQLVEIMQKCPPPPKVYERLAMVIKPWIRADAENELDVALDVLHEIVQHAPTPFAGQVLECILILNDSSIAAIGEETNNLVGSILRICAIRHPR